MIALVLAAGYATRLYPLTLNTPKPLLTVGPKTMIDYIVDEIETIRDVNKIVVVTNHRFAGHFDEWAQKRLSEDAGNGISLPIEIIDDGTTDDSNKLGAIGDIQFVIDKLSIDEDLMIIAGDNLFTYKLSDMYDFFKTNGKDTLVAIHVESVEQLRKLAVANLDEDRLRKQREALDIFKEELDKRETDIQAAEKQNEQVSAELAEREKNQEEREKTFNLKVKKYDDKNINVEQIAKNLNGMRPEAAVGILVAMDDQTVIDVLRKVEEIAAAEGSSSMGSYWLSLMPSDRAAEIQRKMLSKPESLE